MRGIRDMASGRALREGESATPSLLQEAVRDIRVAWAGQCLVLLLSACAPLSEQHQFDRQDRMNLVREEFGRKEAACRRAGGTMQLSVPPLAKAGYHDYKTAKCVKF